MALLKQHMVYVWVLQTFKNGKIEIFVTFSEAKGEKNERRRKSRATRTGISAHEKRAISLKKYLSTYEFHQTGFLVLQFALWYCNDMSLKKRSLRNENRRHSSQLASLRLTLLVEGMIGTLQCVSCQKIRVWVKNEFALCSVQLFGCSTSGCNFAYAAVFEMQNQESALPWFSGFS